MDNKTDGAPSFEQQLARLGEIVRMLERGDAPLADSLGLLDEAEQRVVKLREGPAGPVEEPFEEGAK